MRFVSSVFSKTEYLLGSALARLQGVQLGRRTRVSLWAAIRINRGGRIIIGCDCTVHRGVLLATYRGGWICIGDRCSLNAYTVVYGHGGVQIGNDVRIASHCTLVSSNHVFAEEGVPIAQQGWTAHGITIADNVWVGSGVRILDGVAISSGVILGAGAVVTKAASEPGVYMGAPARRLEMK